MPLTVNFSNSNSSTKYSSNFRLDIYANSSSHIKTFLVYYSSSSILCWKFSIYSGSTLSSSSFNLDKQSGSELFSLTTFSKICCNYFIFFFFFSFTFSASLSFMSSSAFNFSSWRQQEEESVMSFSISLPRSNLSANVA